MANGASWLDEKVSQLIRHEDREPATDPFSWLEDYTVSTEEAEQFADPDFIIDGLIVRGHSHVIASEPNGGKTTIFFSLAADMVRAGFVVVYVNSDISAGDAKTMVSEAAESGIKLLLPEMKAGKSMDDIVRNLNLLNDSGHSLADYIFIFDTLKKMADVINKQSVKQLLKLLRGMTAKGATVICLAHTNKYNGADGKPIFEGTGDIRADVDNLIYLIPEKHENGSMTVSVEPDKQRAALRKITFRIDADRSVTQLTEYYDVAAQKQQREQRARDADIIERIIEAIEAKKIKQCDIVEHCLVHEISRRQCLAVLSRYSKPPQQIWTARKGFQRNVKFYELHP